MILFYEDLTIRKLSRELISNIYSALRENRDYDFKSQIQRAAISIMNNIAEGFERGQQTRDNKQFINFLTISFGSCGEVRSMLYLAEDLNYISKENAEKIRVETKELSSKISGLITYLRNNEHPANQQVNK